MAKITPGGVSGQNYTRGCESLSAFNLTPVVIHASAVMLVTLAPRNILYYTIDYCNNYTIDYCNDYTIDYCNDYTIDYCNNYTIDYCNNYTSVMCTPPPGQFNWTYAGSVSTGGAGEPTPVYGSSTR